MFSLGVIFALLFLVSVILLRALSITNIPNVGFFDYLNILFFNSEKFEQYGFAWNVVSVMHFSLILFFGIIYCSAAAGNYRAGMNQMELIRYGNYSRYFFSCNVKNALNALKFIAMTVLLPLSMLFTDKFAFSKFNSCLGVTAAENCANIIIFLIKIFSFLMLAELIFLALIRRRDYSFSLAIMSFAAVFLTFADSYFKTGFITLGNTKNQLTAVGIYTVIFAVLYSILRREPKSL